MSRFAEAITTEAPSSMTSAPVLAAGATGTFHKGEDFEGELAEASKSWSLDLIRHKSMIDDRSSIIEICRAERRTV
jgi:16S rRNA (guanine527-N7)-methyltransferase